MNNDLVRTRESLLEEQEARTREQNRQRQRAYRSRLTNERRQEILQQRRENRQRAKEQQLRNKMIENDKDVPSTVVAPTENFYYGSCSSGGIVASSESNDFPIRTMEEKAIMIRELSYRSHKWRAKLRVIQKQPPRTTKLGTTTIQQFILTDSEGNIWIKGKITAEPITQRPWYVACNKCNRSTMGDIGTSFTCIECNTEESTATARYKTYNLLQLKYILLHSLLAS
ncbi:unnamed protein product [Camellia sinensis]